MTSNRNQVHITVPFPLLIGDKVRPETSEHGEDAVGTVLVIEHPPADSKGRGTDVLVEFSDGSCDWYDAGNLYKLEEDN